ncbi:hypothetical protein T459_15256 [Capsicum annuum]|uniref:Bet v I/Major latex protein domain-containing protein n=1 Tax=Capsicum annuum TaxID=4072 RepID=A0A2G2ZJX7_CAPAN|nr:hypothetical protein T459_15256 [Capsicum annuum]
MFLVECRIAVVLSALRQLTTIRVANDVAENIGILPGKAYNKFPSWVILFVVFAFLFSAMVFFGLLSSKLCSPCRTGFIEKIRPESWRGDGVVTKGQGYGIHSIHVDGNDALIVFTVVQEARKIVVNEHKLVLVDINCTLFDIEAYASCGSVVNCFFYVQHALRKQGGERVAKQVVDHIDKEKKRISFKFVGGDFVDLYKEFKTTLDVEENWISWTFEYEKQNEDVPEPITLLGIAIDLMKDIDSHHHNK